ncbi:MAG: metallophosphoesterase [Candidatus Rokubacteria bacterium]|nr:metallophosphoesterase [Candidatus Rokubacteria bacterium]
MRRFVAVLTTLLLAGYLYLAWRLTSGAEARIALAVPFALVLIVPMIYWIGGRARVSPADDVVHGLGYVSLAWLNFLALVSLARDALLLVTTTSPAFGGLQAILNDGGTAGVVIASVAVVATGSAIVFRGPRVRHVDIPVTNLPTDLEGFRIVQISDLHVGPTMRGAYVRRVVDMTKALAPDLIALTGDIGDGPVHRLASHVAPLGALAVGGRAFLVLGNHEYYAGGAAWSACFESLGLRVLRNEHVTIERGAARLIVGGVLDPAVRIVDPEAEPRPDLAAAPEAGDACRVLLAHNPSIAPRAEAAGFDLQLSGHTHAGQFFPWTYVIHLVHGPHAAGLSRRGRMWVYTSAGTGTWGPPVRLGTEPELTVLRLVRAASASAASRR